MKMRMNKGTSRTTMMRRSNGPSRTRAMMMRRYEASMKMMKAFNRSSTEWKET
jgi:hypothetical protein